MADVIKVSPDQLQCLLNEFRDNNEQLNSIFQHQKYLIEQLCDAIPYEESLHDFKEFMYSDFDNSLYQLNVRSQKEIESILHLIETITPICIFKATGQIVL